jgi:cell fate regulator YaaT (PSP1 superfamily)
LEQNNIIGIQFRRAGRIYDYSGGTHKLKIGDQVVVETERGPALARVVQKKIASTLSEIKTISRVANERDLSTSSILSDDKALDIAQAKVKDFGLNMKIIKAEVQFGGGKVMLYFTAPGRVDFRDLVKALAGSLKSRVELKQVGERDETKLMGGVGICGREYCCSSFLRDFVPVSIKMAKNQNLALNPTKVSGGCGRLLCCLTYENDLYTELRTKLPAYGTQARTRQGEEGMVVRSDLLNQTVIISTRDGQQIEAKIEEIEILNKKGESTSPKNKGEDYTWGEDIDLKGLMDD